MSYPFYLKYECKIMYSTLNALVEGWDIRVINRKNMDYPARNNINQIHELKL